MGFGDFDALHAFEMINRGDLADFLVAIAVDAGAGIADFDFAADNFAEGNTPEVIGVIEVGDQHLETFAGMGARRRDVLDDGVEQRLHRAAGMGEFHFGVTLPWRWRK